MRLTEGQLINGFRAAAEFLSDDKWSSYDKAQQYYLTKQMYEWLAPCLLRLPEGATKEELLEGVFRQEFRSAARLFLLKHLRENPIYDNDSDEELMLRLPKDEVARSGENLAFLCSLVLGRHASPKTPKGPRLSTLLKNFHSVDLEASVASLTVEASDSN